MGNIVFNYNKGAKAFDKSLYRKEASRLISVANKRLRRLEKNDLQDSPAYKRLVNDRGTPQFSVKGKSFNELQKEVSDLMRFLNSDTSTIRGINSTLKDMASNTGIKYRNLTELKKKSSKFFELSSKVEQYLTTVEDMGSAIGYNQIWEVINEYTEAQKIDLSGSLDDIDSIVENVSQILSEVKSDKGMHDYDMKNNWVFLE